MEARLAESHIQPLLVPTAMPRAVVIDVVVFQGDAGELNQGWRFTSRSETMMVLSGTGSAWKRAAASLTPPCAGRGSNREGGRDARCSRRQGGRGSGRPTRSRCQ